MLKIHAPMVLLAVFALLFTTPAMIGTVHAQSAGEFATLNIQLIMRDAKAAKSVREQLSSKQKAFQSDMESKENSLQKEEKELVNQRSLIAPEAFEQKLKEFRGRMTSAQKDLQAKKVQLDNAFAKALADIQKAVFDIVSKIAKEKGLKVVIPTSELIYADPAMDISDEVLAELNSSMPDLKVDFK